MNSSTSQIQSSDGWTYLTNSEYVSSSELSSYTILGATVIIAGIMKSKDDNSNNSIIDKNITDTNNISSTSHVSPLVFDLNANGINTVSLENGVIFDINGDSKLEKTAWIDGKDGFLVLDLNKDGIINDGSELFEQGTTLVNGEKANNGFEALAQYDINKDNRIDINDNIFESLQIWVDKNIDANTTKDELFTLTQLGIKSISLDSKDSNLIDNENIIGLVSIWQDKNNNKNELADVWFKIEEKENILSSNTDAFADLAIVENQLVYSLPSVQNEEVSKTQAII